MTTRFKHRPLNHEQKKVLEIFISTHIEKVPWKVITLYFRHIFTLRNKEELQIYIEEYGILLFNHLLIALHFSVPWVTTEDKTNLLKLTYPEIGKYLCMPNHQLYKYVWVNAKTFSIVKQSNNYFTDIVECVDEGYKYENLLVYPINDSFAFLTVESCCMCNFSPPIQNTTTICCCKELARKHQHFFPSSTPFNNDNTIEIPCVYGGYMMTKNGISIERTGFALDYENVEYFVINSSKYFYLHKEANLDVAFNLYFSS